jgi:cobyrinic acid a,c-diamide synthase
LKKPWNRSKSPFWAFCIVTNRSPFPIGGLIPAAEIHRLEQIFDRLAELAKNCFDWEQLLPLLKPNRTIKIQNSPRPAECEGQLKSKIAVARDRAFSFYYPDNLEQLEALGAELIPWSPIADSSLPEGIQGLYFGGGFPEIFAQQLTHNKSARQAVRAAIQAGIPTYAECGGLMYLSEQIIDFKGQSWPMVGVLPTTTIMGQHLALGYRQATTLQDSPILSQKQTIWGHEFHRSQPTSLPTKPLFAVRGANAQNSSEGWKIHQLHASYIHLHWGTHSAIAQRFLQHCLQ